MLVISISTKSMCGGLRICISMAVSGSCMCMRMCSRQYVCGDDAISCVCMRGDVLYCTDGMCYVCSGDVCYHMYWRGEQLVAVIACVAVVMPRAVCLSVCGREHQREQQQQVVVVRCVSWWGCHAVCCPWCCVCWCNAMDVQ